MSRRFLGEAPHRISSRASSSFVEPSFLSSIPASFVLLHMDKSQDEAVEGV
jgi:hypothetical protein